MILRNTKKKGSFNKPKRSVKPNRISERSVMKWLNLGELLLLKFVLLYLTVIGLITVVVEKTKFY